MPLGSKRVNVNLFTNSSSGTPYWRPKLTAAPKTPVSNFKEYVAYAKSKPGQVSIASAGNVVFTERVDYLALNDGAKVPVPLPVVGVMEMRDGKIFAWRDYFDLRTAEEGLGIAIRTEGAGSGTV